MKNLQNSNENVEKSTNLLAVRTKIAKAFLRNTHALSAKGEALRARVQEALDSGDKLKISEIALKCPTWENPQLELFAELDVDYETASRIFGIRNQVVSIFKENEEGEMVLNTNLTDVDADDIEPRAKGLGIVMLTEGCGGKCKSCITAAQNKVKSMNPITLLQIAEWKGHFDDRAQALSVEDRIRNYELEFYFATGGKINFDTKEGVSNYRDFIENFKKWKPDQETFLESRTTYPNSIGESVTTDFIYRNHFASGPVIDKINKPVIDLISDLTEHIRNEDFNKNDGWFHIGGGGIFPVAHPTEYAKTEGQKREILKTLHTTYSSVDSHIVYTYFDGDPIDYRSSELVHQNGTMVDWGDVILALASSKRRIFVATQGWLTTDQLAQRGAEKIVKNHNNGVKVRLTISEDNGRLAREGYKGYFTHVKNILQTFLPMGFLTRFLKHYQEDDSYEKNLEKPTEIFLKAKKEKGYRVGCEIERIRPQNNKSFTEGFSHSGHMLNVDGNVSTAMGKPYGPSHYYRNSFLLPFGIDDKKPLIQRIVLENGLGTNGKKRF